MKACLPQDADRTLKNAFLAKTGITEKEKRKKMRNTGQYAITYI